MAIREPIVSDSEAQRVKRPRRSSRGSLLGLFVLLALVVIVAIVFGFPVLTTYADHPEALIVGLTGGGLMPPP